MGNMMKPTRDCSAVANTIVERHKQRRADGECRVDDKLYLDLCQVLPEKAAQETVRRFTKRRAHSDRKAEVKLGMEIAIALDDADLFASTAKPIIQSQAVAPVEDCGRPSAANTYAKVLAGQPLTDADENAVVFDEQLKDE